MECVINSTKGANNVLFVKSNEDFKRELTQGYFNALIHEKQVELNQYLNAYNELEEKDTFKADYLDSLIYLLNLEIKELQKYF